MKRLFTYFSLLGAYLLDQVAPVTTEVFDLAVAARMAEQYARECDAQTKLAAKEATRAWSVAVCLNNQLRAAQQAYQQDHQEET